RDQRRGQGEQLHVLHAAAKINTVDDIAPLVRTAHLQDAVVTFVQLNEIVCLQDHVVEFKKRQFLLAIETQLDGIEREHPIDRKMPANVAQEINVVELVQPVGVIRHDGIAARSFEFQEFGKYRPYAGQIVIDHLVSENPA